MSSLIFINYRRDDSAPVVRALAENLRYRLGADKVFLDEDSIQEGEKWPDRLELSVNEASVVLCVIGPHWLTAADPYGRRRLDHKGDWVRKELLRAKLNRVEVIPILLGKQNSPLDKPVGMPKKLTWLCDIQSMSLCNDSWHADIFSLTDRLISKNGFSDIQRSPILPEPGVEKRDEVPLKKQELINALQSLKGWEPVQSTYPPRRELRKIYHFKTFAMAIAFMNKSVRIIEREPVHHPRWENQYRTVTVYFSTWDAGSTISRYDVDAAKGLDKVYEGFL